ncbi:MAG TPA: TolC family protein, partial [Prolixibacteraceae bacterium]|nr:TolC family protein [Prolixibacteraceae bacterium]
MFRKQRQILLLAGIFMFGAAMMAPAQEPVKLSLQEALAMAHQNNANILNSELDLKSAQKRIWETIATGLPHVDASGSYQHIFKVPTLSFPSSELSTTRKPFDAITQTGTVGNGVGLSTGDSIFTNMVAGPAIELGVKDNITYDFTLSQLIFSGSYLVGLQASKVFYGYAEQNAEKTRLDVTETVINTYNMIRLAEESKKILSQNLENIDKTLYEVTEMNKQGFVEKTDVDQLELTGTTIKNALNQIESNLDMGYRLLKIQIGMDEATKVELSDPLESGESLTASSLELINQPFSLERNVDYKLIQTSEKQASLEL